VSRYLDGSFVLTDVAPAMIAECRRNLAPAKTAHISYEVMDAGEAGGHAGLDLIVSKHDAALAFRSCCKPEAS
jgi:hypothetical protein